MWCARNSSQRTALPAFCVKNPENCSSTPLSLLEIDLLPQGYTLIALANAADPLQELCVILEFSFLGKSLMQGFEFALHPCAYLFAHGVLFGNFLLFRQQRINSSPWRALSIVAPLRSSLRFVCAADSTLGRFRITTMSSNPSRRSISQLACVALPASSTIDGRAGSSVGCAFAVFEHNVVLISSNVADSLALPPSTFDCLGNPFSSKTSPNVTRGRS